MMRIVHAAAVPLVIDGQRFDFIPVRAPAGMGLTKRQREVLDLLRRWARDGIYPSLRQIGATLGCNHGTALGLIDRLEKRGYVRRLRGRARAISLVLP